MTNRKRTSQRKKAVRRKRKRRINPVRLLGILLLECVVLLGILVYLYQYHPNHFISKALRSMLEPIPQVLLDPGHGGYDSGSEFNGILEKDVTLALAKDVGAALEAKGIPVAYTREDDEVDWASIEKEDLNERVAIANESGARLFVSLHTNASETKNGSGFEIWGYIQKEENLQLAEAVHDALAVMDYTIDRGIKDAANAPLQVLYANKLPCVLIEAGFLESDHDRDYLLQEGKRHVVASKIADGIERQLQAMSRES